MKLRRPLRIPCALAALFWTMTQIVQGQSAPPEELYPDEFRWEKRLLIVYAPKAESGKLKAHRRLWTGAGRGPSERDLLMFEWEGADRLPERVRDRYGIDPAEFTVLLVGKDGGVKLVSRDPVGPKQIYPLIDSMR